MENNVRRFRSGRGPIHYVGLLLHALRPTAKKKYTTYLIQKKKKKKNDNDYYFLGQRCIGQDKNKKIINSNNNNKQVSTNPSASSGDDDRLVICLSVQIGLKALNCASENAPPKNNFTKNCISDPTKSTARV